MLQTLPTREFAAGMAEVIKYGLLADAALFNELERLDTHSGSPELALVIRRCCAIKARSSPKTKRKTAIAGGRALLNLGHTFAHAIENVAGYGDYLHGEAVAIGLHLAAILSLELGQIDACEISHHRPPALSIACSSSSIAFTIEQLMQAMRCDKKNRSGQLRFVTLQEMGQAVTSDGIEAAQIERVSGSRHFRVKTRSSGFAGA